MTLNAVHGFIVVVFVVFLLYFSITELERKIEENRYDMYICIVTYYEINAE